jgi:hypothetical protein
MNKIKGLIVLLFVLVVLVSCARKPEVVETETTSVVEAEVTSVVEHDGMDVTSDFSTRIEKDTFEGGAMNIITTLEQYDVDVHTVQINQYGDYELVVAFEYDEIDYYLRSKDVETIGEFSFEIIRIMNEVEKIVNE